MTAKEQLYEKLSAEYDAFIDGLKGAAPDKIIESAYEKVFKEDILMCFEYGDSFSEKQIAALLAVEYPLDSLYHNWLDTDVSYMDDLRDTIDNFINREAGLQSEIDGEEITEAATNTTLNNSETQTARTIYSDVQPGDWVIAAGNNDYRYLIGMVTAIDKLGTSGHDTENETDDIHVDFTVFDYSNERIVEIEDYFCDLHGELRAIDNLSLDDVIMAPKMLISISNLSQDEIDRMGNLRQNCEAFCNCFPGAGELQGDLHAALMERIEKNLTDYHNSLMGFGKRELIDMAGKIADVSEAYTFMAQYHKFTDEELGFYLQYQNPLAIVADAWHDRNDDTFSDTMGDMVYTNEALLDKSNSFAQQYPLMSHVEKLSEIREQQPEKPPADKKLSISDRLAAGNEKVKAYKEQKAQTPENTTKHKKEDITQ